MSNIVRSLLVVAAVLGGVSTASATTINDGFVNGGSSQPLSPRAFFEQQMRNGN